MKTFILSLLLCIIGTSSYAQNYDNSVHDLVMSPLEDKIPEAAHHIKKWDKKESMAEHISNKLHHALNGLVRFNIVDAIDTGRSGFRLKGIVNDIHNITETKWETVYGYNVAKKRSESRRVQKTYATTTITLTLTLTNLTTGESNWKTFTNTSQGEGFTNLAKAWKAMLYDIINYYNNLYPIQASFNVTKENDDKIKEVELINLYEPVKIKKDQVFHVVATDAISPIEEEIGRIKVTSISKAKDGIYKCKVTKHAEAIKEAINGGKTLKAVSRHKEPWIWFAL